MVHYFLITMHLGPSVGMHDYTQSHMNVCTMDFSLKIVMNPSGIDLEALCPFVK